MEIEEDRGPYSFPRFPSVSGRKECVLFSVDRTQASPTLIATALARKENCTRSCLRREIEKETAFQKSVWEVGRIKVIPLSMNKHLVRLLLIMETNMFHILQL